MQIMNTPSVLATTAIPAELRPLGRVTVDFSLGVSDALLNLAGYLPARIDDDHGRN